MCLSLIKFNQLKDIDLSGNEITDIEPICNMKLPFLEFLNLSDNKIENIKPLREINSRKLKYLFIQNNQIKDIEVLVDPNFLTFEILRVENNNIDNNSASFKELLKLYKNRILIEDTRKIDEIKNIINYNEKYMEVEETNLGDLILKYIFIIVPSNNKIRKLKLKGNKIKDPSILNRIQFNFLKEIDLRINNINNLICLKGMKAKKLESLFLDNNNVNDLSLLYDIKKLFPYLKVISLKENNFEPNEQQKLTVYLEGFGIKIYF